jgi:hypothetical protein
MGERGGEGEELIVLVLVRRGGTPILTKLTQK